jgi:hypothetical protein
MTQTVKEMGYENLDFKGNFGHSIERQPDRRRYIEAGNMMPVGEAGLFTFEPHIRKKNCVDGFKYENIYYFDNTRAMPLGDLALLKEL